MPRAPASAYFGGFLFETASARLWRGDEELPLRPKTADVLRCLVTRAGEVVSKDQLLEAVWPEAFIGDNALAVCIHELRNALGDDAHHPTYIATSHRYGYRFLAPVSSAPPSEARLPRRPLVGRETELDVLGERWRRASGGHRQIAFIAAEAGVGKTAVVEAFAASLPGSTVHVGWGQCVEMYGDGEPYLPVLDALTGLCHGPDGPRIWQVLTSEAPTWALQLTGLLEPDDLEGLQLQTLGATSDRMLRELAQALETLSSTLPLLLVFEDLHDADPATIGLLSYLARRRQQASLMVLATYRPVEARTRSHPLRQVVQDLQARELCHLMALDLLPPGAVDSYLAQQLTPNRPSRQLAADVYRRTDGNALFLVDIVDYLTTEGVLKEESGVVHSRQPLAEIGMPERLRQLIDLHIERLDDDDRELVEVAAAIGLEFTTDTVMAALGHSTGLAEIETRTRHLATESSLLSPAGSVLLPDGTFVSRFRFTHALYQEVLYDHHLDAVRKRRAHRRIGARIASVHEDQPADVAAELAVHFQRGSDPERAVQFLGLAAQTALERSAHATATDHTDHALELIAQSSTAWSDESELQIRLTEASALMMAKGFQSPDVENAYSKADDLAAALGDEAARVAILCGRWNAAMTCGDLTTAVGFATDLAAVSERSADPAHRLQAHNLVGMTDLFSGRPRSGVERVEKGRNLYDPVDHRHLALTYGEDPEVVRLLYGAIAYWLLGRPDVARAGANQGLALARDLGYPAGITQALWHTGVVYQLTGDARHVRDLTDELLHVSHDYDLPTWIPLGKVLNGWARARAGHPTHGLTLIEDGLDQWDVQGFELTRPYHTALLADVLMMVGERSKALAVTEQALNGSRASGERWFEAELSRMKAELRHSEGMSDIENLEKSLSQSLEIAHLQGAKSLELRTAISIVRQSQGRDAATRARSVLTAIYDSIDEGYDTEDLVAAKSLLAELD